MFKRISKRFFLSSGIDVAGLLLVFILHFMIVNVIYTMPEAFSSLNAIQGSEIQQLSMGDIEQLSALATTLQKVVAFILLDLILGTVIILLLNFVSNNILFSKKKKAKQILKDSKKFAFNYFVGSILFLIVWVLLILIMYNILPTMTFIGFLFVMLAFLAFAFFVITINAFTAKKFILVFKPTLRQLGLFLIYPIIILILGIISFVPIIGGLLFWILFGMSFTYLRLIMYNG